MAALTFSEKVLSAKCGTEARAGQIVVCGADLILGTDGSTPMAIELFEQMLGSSVVRPENVILSRDHYSPPRSTATREFHTRMEEFARFHAVELLDVGQGIGFRIALERGIVGSGDLVVGADSHTVTCGAAGAFATGIGSTDLAAAMLTGMVWLRVPETIQAVLEGDLPTGVDAKDIALEIIRRLGPDGANYKAIEFIGPLADDLSLDDRMVISNMSTESGAKAGVFPDSALRSDDGADTAARFNIDCTQLEPLVALPPEPTDSVPVSRVVGTEVSWVLLGTCSGGSEGDFRSALRIIETGGGVASGVTLVVTPPSHEVLRSLKRDGTLASFQEHGAVFAVAGCGPCCGTSAPTPPAGARVISTANRNYTGRMGEPSATIYLASPQTCAASAVAGCITDPRECL